VGYGPVVALSLVALGLEAAADAAGPVTVSSAIALVVGSLFIYGWQAFAAWVFSIRGAARRLSLWGFRSPGKAILWIVPLALVAVYVVSYFHELVVRPEEQEILRQFPRSTAGIVLFVIMAVIMAPLFEEVFFRGFLFHGFATSWGWVWGAVASSAIFAVAHLQLSIVAPLFALGFALAWVYKRTGSLWTSIALHAVFNGLSVFAWAVGG
jgi:membrane protease YdiL (CAAX protease family)